MPASKHDDWTRLVNTHVEIRCNGAVLRTGTVDDVMPDSSALWIAADGNTPRQIFEASLGHEAWATPQELTGTTRYQLAVPRISQQKPSRP